MKWRVVKGSHSCENRQYVSKPLDKKTNFSWIWAYWTLGTLWMARIVSWTSESDVIGAHTKIVFFYGYLRLRRSVWHQPNRKNNPPKILWSFDKSKIYITSLCMELKSIPLIKMGIRYAAQRISWRQQSMRSLQNADDKLSASKQLQVIPETRWTFLITCITPFAAHATIAWRILRWRGVPYVTLPYVIQCSVEREIWM